MVVNLDWKVVVNLTGFSSKALQQILNDDIDVKSFFIDRFTRIMLPLIAALLLMVIIAIIVGDSIPLKDILGSLFSLQGILTGSGSNAPLWSLAYEVWFYIFLGCLMIICRGKNRNNILIAFFVLTICISIFTKLKTRYLLILLMGTFAFLLPRENIKYLNIKIFILLTLLGCSCFLSQLTSETRSLNTFAFSFLEHKQISVFLAFIAVLLIHHLIVAKPQRRIWANVESVSVKFSAFSYTLYLTHYPLMPLLAYFGFPKSKQINMTSIMYYIVEIIISLVVAYLIYLVSEKKTSSIKKYIKSQLTKQQ